MVMGVGNETVAYIINTREIKNNETPPHHENRTVTASGPPISSPDGDALAFMLKRENRVPSSIEVVALAGAHIVVFAEVKVVQF